MVLMQKQKMKWLRLKDAQKYLKKETGLDVSIARIRNWITKGTVNYSGYKILLRARKRFDMWYTTAEWIDDFIKEQSE